MRIFGDVRAFECAICDYMILKYAAEPMPSAQIIRPLLDAAEGGCRLLRLLTKNKDSRSGL
jgi:hypothetical protein